MLPGRVQQMQSICYPTLGRVSLLMGVWARASEIWERDKEGLSKNSLLLFKIQEDRAIWKHMWLILHSCVIEMPWRMEYGSKTIHSQMEFSALWALRPQWPQFSGHDYRIQSFYSNENSGGNKLVWCFFFESSLYLLHIYTVYKKGVKRIQSTTTLFILTACK